MSIATKTSNAPLVRACFLLRSNRVRGRFGVSPQSVLDVIWPSLPPFTRLSGVGRHLAKHQDLPRRLVCQARMLPAIMSVSGIWASHIIALSLTLWGGLAKAEG